MFMNFNTYGLHRIKRHPVAAHTDGYFQQESRQGGRDSPTGEIK
jgi:hypothetical protein